MNEIFPIAGYPATYSQTNTDNGARVTIHWDEPPPQEVYDATLKAATDWCGTVTTNQHWNANAYREGADVVIVTVAPGQDNTKGVYQAVDRLKQTLRTLALTRGAGSGEEQAAGRSGALGGSARTREEVPA